MMNHAEYEKKLPLMRRKGEAAYRDFVLRHNKSSFGDDEEWEDWACERFVPVFEIPKSKPRLIKSQRILVANLNPINAALKRQGRKVAILHFFDPRKAKRNGSLERELGLRSSFGGYLATSGIGREIYQELPLGKGESYFSYGVPHYAEDVTIFKKEDGTLLPEHRWRKADLILCPVPAYREKGEGVGGILTGMDAISFCLDLAAAKGVDVLIIGSFPHARGASLKGIVSTYRKHLEAKRFLEVEFALHAPYRGKGREYALFAEAFS